MNPPLPVPFALPDIGEEEIAAAVSVLRSGWLTTGPNAKAFESDFTKFLGVDAHAVSVNSATAGLHLAFEAIGISPGDEVLMPTWTFTATAEAVRYLGADPVFVDVDPVTLIMDLDAATAAVTPRTKAIAPVHFAGLGTPNAPLTALAKKHGLRVIEDAAHSFPTVSDGRVIGSHGHDATVFSFYATKTITTGEGGMVVTQDADLAARMRVMRLHGINRDVFDRYTNTQSSWYYEVVAPGFKYNLTDLAAAIGRVQLTRACEMAVSRRDIALRYNAELADLPLDLPADPEGPDTHAWHLYVARLRPDARLNRAELTAELGRHGVGVSVHFIPLHLHPYWRDQYSLKPSDLPVASAEYERVFSLPIYSSMGEKRVSRVIAVLRELLG